MSDDLVKRYRQLQEVIGGCHDGYCVVRKPKGMHTNGGCTCLEDLRLHERSRIGHLLRCAQEMADRIEELEAKLAKAVEALDGVMVGGNHLAVWLSDDHPPAEVEPLAALEKIGAGVSFDVWCCWRSIMLARTTLAELTGGKDE